MKYFFTAMVAIFLIAPSVSAEMLLFVGEGCEYCEALRSELQQQNFYNTFQIAEYEIYNDEYNESIYLQKSQELGYTGGLVPLLVDDEKYFEGIDPILAYLQSQQQSSTIDESKLTQAESEILTDIISSHTDVTLPTTKTVGKVNIWAPILTVLIIAGLITALQFYRRKKN